MRLVAACLLLLSISAITWATTVGVYCSGPSDTAYGRIKKLGYNTIQLTSESQITSGNLSEMDVLFVADGLADALSGKSAVIQQFVAYGGGLIVEQPNVEGLVAILPACLAVNIYSHSYDGSKSGSDPGRSVMLTEAGKDHLITMGLAAEDICQNADQVRRSDIGPKWTVLAVQQNRTDLVALAVGQYGSGRIVFETGNSHPDAMSPGSDLYLRKMIDWAAKVI